MDDGTRSRNWMAEATAVPEHRPDPGRLLAPLLTVALTLATPLALPVPVAAVLILVALTWFGSRIQESGSEIRPVEGTLRTDSVDAPRSRGRRAYSDGWA